MLTKNSKTEIIYILLLSIFILYSYIQSTCLKKTKNQSLFGESRKIPEIKIYNFCNLKSNSNSYPNSMFRDSHNSDSQSLRPVSPKSPCQLTYGRKPTAFFRASPNTLHMTTGHRSPYSLLAILEKQDVPNTKSYYNNILCFMLRDRYDINAYHNYDMQKEKITKPFFLW